MPYNGYTPGRVQYWAWSMNRCIRIFYFFIFCFYLFVIGTRETQMPNKIIAFERDETFSLHQIHIESLVDDDEKNENKTDLFGWKIICGWMVLNAKDTCVSTMSRKTKAEIQIIIFILWREQRTRYWVVRMYVVMWHKHSLCVLDVSESCQRNDRSSTKIIIIILEN